jgi:hypothetical protein
MANHTNKQYKTLTGNKNSLIGNTLALGWKMCICCFSFVEGKIHVTTKNKTTRKSIKMLLPLHFPISPNPRSNK